MKNLPTLYLLNCLAAALLLGTPAAQAQNKQVWNTYFDKCVEATNQADWKAVYNFCPAAWNEAAKFGTDSPQMGDTENIYGILFENQGRYNEAEQRHLHALAIRERRSHLSTNNTELLADTQNNLAGVFKNLGRLQEAEALYRKALAIRESVLGSTHPEVGQTQSNLGNVLKDMGEYAQAETLYQSAIAIAQAREPNSNNLATAYINLAVLYSNMGHYAEALAFDEKSLALRTQILPAQHPHIAHSMNNLAYSHLALGAADKALPLLQQALAIFRANFADSHPDIAQTLVNLGRAYAALGRNAEAEAHLREGLKLRESAKSVGLIAYALEQLAPVLRANKKSKEAATMEKRAASLRKQAG
jgi:tetratricopeptide (TPR) repeat protein